MAKQREVRLLKTCQACWMGRMEYEPVWELQKRLAAARAENRVADTLLLLEHFPTYTLGRRGNPAHLLASPESLAKQGVRVLRVDRGGDITYHGPGQLVVYPIIDLKARQGGIGRYLRDLEEVVIRVLAAMGMTGQRISAYTGVWVGDKKVAAIGVRVDVRGITRHGFALNVATDLEYFSRIVPCGIPDKGVTSVASVRGGAGVASIAEVAGLVAAAFGKQFDAAIAPISVRRLHILLEDEAQQTPSVTAPGPVSAPVSGGGIAKGRKPPWLRVPFPGGEAYERVKSIVRRNSLHTVCREALCPNVAECWGRGTATFMILGNRCTRRCAFCGVSSGRPAGAVNRREAARVAEAAAAMGLRHAVVTSVTRDDLQDGGASVFAETIRQIKSHCQGCSVEVLVPDLGGNCFALKQVVDAAPDVLAHNLETVLSLHSSVRPQAEYDRSLMLLQRAKELRPGIITKSGIMVGLGERWQELVEAMEDLRAVKCDVLTVGQYLQPRRASHPVVRYYRPEEFAALEAEARRAGFLDVRAGPLVRSSYQAEQIARQALSERTIQSSEAFGD